MAELREGSEAFEEEEGLINPRRRSSEMRIAKWCMLGVVGALLALAGGRHFLHRHLRGNSRATMQASLEYPQWDDLPGDDGDAGGDESTAWEQPLGGGYGGELGSDWDSTGSSGGYGGEYHDKARPSARGFRAYGYGGGVGPDDHFVEQGTTTSTTTTVHFYPPRPPVEKYKNHYDAANPLQIMTRPLRSNNYFLILGDWGKAGGPGSCQLAVAAHLREYVAWQKSLGKHLLFIASVGDNFYWTGATPEAWLRTWAQPYGANDPNSPTSKVPWLSLYGNHDFGNSDPHAFCPHLFPRRIRHGQPYSSHQLNQDKFPDRPNFTEKYWLPDYNYHYELPDADLEVIAVDTNGRVEPGVIGGDKGGREKADEKCGGQATSQAFLVKLAESGEELVKERAMKSTAGTVLLLQHYPGHCPRGIFEGALPASRKGKVKVLCAYGHDHNQKCDKKDENGLCIDVLSGGGGGCCGPMVNLAGFTAVHLDDASGVKSVDVESSSVRLAANSCKW